MSSKQSKQDKHNKHNKNHKNLEGKRAGLVAYTEDGYLLVVYQNVNIWSFPKGHYDEKLDESLLDTALREFREETNYKEYIDPSRIINKMKTSPDTTLFLLEMTPEEVSNIELIDGINVRNDEILNSAWIHINYLDYFRNAFIVNKTISNFNIPHFLLLSRLNISSFSFRNIRKSRKNKKSIKSRKTRKSRKSRIRSAYY